MGGALFQVSGRARKRYALPVGGIPRTASAALSDMTEDIAAAPAAPASSTLA